MSHILINGAGGVGSVVVHKCAQVLKERIFQGNAGDAPFPVAMP